MKPKLINGVLWLAFLLAMAASISHLAWTFGTVERPGHEWLGWVPAVAVDTGLAALAYTIQQRKRAKHGVAILWAGVVGFAAVSALANLYHALADEGVAIAADWVVYAKALCYQRRSRSLTFSWEKSSAGMMQRKRTNKRS